MRAALLLKSCPASRSRGAAAIEFSLIFMILLMLLYGIVGYFGPLLLAASYQQVASEALREAVTARYQPGEPRDLQQQVSDVIERSWLPPQWVHNCSDYPDPGFLRIDGGLWQVCLRHPSPRNIILPLPFVQLPNEIRGEATLCIGSDCD
ncbi:MAG: hypothetical protein M0Q95_21020 [Porticoccaceae bacterium]|nr:hypothetical protein [Porticoccaceae bacterium]